MGNASSIPFLGTGVTLSVTGGNSTKLEEAIKEMYLSPIYWSIISVGGIFAIFSLYKIIKVQQDRNR